MSTKKEPTEFAEISAERIGAGIYSMIVECGVSVSEFSSTSGIDHSALTSIILGDQKTNLLMIANIMYVAEKEYGVKASIHFQARRIRVNTVKTAVPNPCADLYRKAMSRR